MNTIGKFSFLFGWYEFGQVCAVVLIIFCVALLFVAVGNLLIWWSMK